MGQVHDMYLESTSLQKPIPLDSKLNIRIRRTASGSKKYAAFAVTQRSETSEVKVFETHIIPDMKLKQTSLLKHK